MNSQIDTVSEITLTVQDVQELETELAKYSQIYRDLFGRREQKEQYAVYLQGLMSDLGDFRKMIEGQCCFCPVSICRWE